MTPEDKIVAAIDRNTEALADVERTLGGMDRTLAMIFFALCFLGMTTCGSGMAKTSPITHHSAASEPLQHWYTVDVPTPSGVFPTEVYTPVLPLFEQPQIVVLDEALRLVETPEPGTGLLFFLGGACWFVGLFLIRIVWAITRDHREIHDRMEKARKALEYSAHKQAELYRFRKETIRFVCVVPTDIYGIRRRGEGATPLEAIRAARRGM
jgi:hypothetical protein